MSHQQDCTAEAILESQERGYTLARLISQVFHPLTLSTFSLLLVGFFAHSRWWVGIAWALFTIVLQVVPSTLFYIIRLRQGAYSDEDISVREQRNELYIFSIISTLLAIGVLVLLQAPLEFVAVVCGGILLIIINWQINLFWKISAHASAIGLSSTIATIYVPPLGVLLWGCALMVGWARVRTRNHTPLQVLAGLALSTTVFLSMFLLFDLV